MSTVLTLSLHFLNNDVRCVSMSSADRNHFDFDEWSALVRENADAFEFKRQEFIGAVPAPATRHMQWRQRGLQFRIDLERKRGGMPLGAAVRPNSMMWSSFLEMRDALSNMDEGATTAEPQRRKATLLQFPKCS